jgi:hypothetical protein
LFIGSLKTQETIKFVSTLQPRPSIFRFPLFRALKSAVHSVKFKADDDMISAVRTWLHEQGKEWYQQCIHALVSQCKAVEVDGDFVEK